MSPTLSKERALLQKCLQEIEDQLDWGPSDGWTQRNFQDLCELIQEKSGIRISVSTLKRIWQPASQSRPHPATLNALAGFLGYGDWLSYQQHHSRPGTPEEQRHSSSSFPVRKVLLPLASIFILILIIAAFSSRKSTQPQGDFSQLPFRVESMSKGIPNTVLFHYDLSGSGLKQALLQQSWDKRLTKVLEAEHTVKSCLYYYPGFYRAKLRIGDEVIKETPLHITTDGWQALVERQLNETIPVYIRNTSFPQSGPYYVSPDTLKSHLIDLHPQTHWVDFYRVEDFGALHSSDVSLKLQIKNAALRGGIGCQEARIMLIGEHGRIQVPLLNKGCVNKAFVVAGEKVLEGENHDLSFLGQNMDQWNQVAIQQSDHQFQLLINDEIVFQENWRVDIGRIVGVRLKFEGSGEMKEMRLSGNGLARQLTGGE